MGLSEEKKKERQKEANLKYQQTNKYKEYRRRLHRDQVYDEITNYIKNYTEDNVKKLFNKNDDVASIRRKFKEQYGLKKYKEHIII